MRDAGPQSPGRSTVGLADIALLNAATDCSSRAEFVRLFRRYVDEVTIFVPAHVALPVGQAVRFVIALRDGTPGLEGTGKVISVEARGVGPARRAGVHIRISELSEATRGVRDEILGRGPPTFPPGPIVPLRPPLPISMESSDGWDGPTRQMNHPVIPAQAFRNTPALGTKVVPANPFSGMSTQALSFYVECQLSEDEDLAAVPPALPPPPPEPSAADTFEEPAASLDDGRLLEAEPVGEAGDGVADEEFATAPAGRRRMVLVGVSLMAAATAAWILIRPGADRRAPAVAAAPPALAVPARAAAPAEPPPAPVAAPAPPTEAPAPTEAAPPSRSGTCRAAIRSQPSGAAVRLGSRALGRTPLQDVAVPCGASTIVLSRARYSDLRQTLNASSENKAAMSVKLARPRAELVVVSSPPNAVVKINRRPAGRAPRTLAVSRYERLRIDVTLPGHRSWSQKVYVANAVTRVEAVLKPR